MGRRSHSLPSLANMVKLVDVVTMMMERMLTVESGDERMMLILMILKTFPFCGRMVMAMAMEGEVSPSLLDA